MQDPVEQGTNEDLESKIGFKILLGRLLDGLGSPGPRGKVGTAQGSNPLGISCPDPYGPSTRHDPKADLLPRANAVASSITCIKSQGMKHN